VSGSVVLFTMGESNASAWNSVCPAMTLIDRKLCSGCMDLLGWEKVRFDCKLGQEKAKCPGHRSDLGSVNDETNCQCCKICRNSRVRLKGKLSNSSLGIRDRQVKGDSCCKCSRELRYSYYLSWGNTLMETSSKRLHDLVDSEISNIVTSLSLCTLKSS
jgi:hypothetical protein